MHQCINANPDHLLRRLTFIEKTMMKSGILYYDTFSSAEIAKGQTAYIRQWGIVLP